MVAQPEGEGFQTLSPAATATPDLLAPSSNRVLASFRDPGGCLYRLDNRILRVINPRGEGDAKAFLTSSRGQALMESGRVIRSRLLSSAETMEQLADPDLRELYNHANGCILVEHERLPFPSYPYEWPAEMLHAAGALTLDLGQEMLDDNLGLKDATPYNVLFRGPQPVFVDLLSFEGRDAGDSTWLAYAQFVRTFLLPLLAHRYFGLTLDQLLLTRRDGLEPQEVYRWLTPWQKFRSPFFGLVSMPKWLAGMHDPDNTRIYRPRPLQNQKKARFVLDGTLNRLRRTLHQLPPRPGQKSAWSGYMASNSYTDQHFAAKQAFVHQAMQEFAPRSVLDVGCNSGFFSAIAAQAGAQVVAIDCDPVVLGELWQAARAQRLNILPLAVNLARPSPGIGWQNQECASFLERARGQFDAVLMLAVIHHMLVTERIPLADIMELAAELTTKLLVIEFVSPQDAMFRRLVRGREELHQDLTLSFFEQTAGRRFTLLRSQHLEGTTRWLYLLRKK